MKKFTSDYLIRNEYPKCFTTYTGNLKTCVFDIEATGLDPSFSTVCMAALLVPTQRGIRITQFLAQNSGEELQLLTEVMDFIEKKGIECLITFNGHAFDIPFFNRRLKAHFNAGTLRKYNFDLYRFIRKGSGLKEKLSSLSQVSLEEHYGIRSMRRDTISGREFVSIYSEYSETGAAALEKLMLTHNKEDVLQLHRLMLLCPDDQEDFDRAMSAHGFPSPDGKYSVTASVTASGRRLRISGAQLRNPISAQLFPDMDSPVSALFEAETAVYRIELPLRQASAGSAAAPVSFLDTVQLGIDMSEDPDCINGFLIINSGTLNRVSVRILEKTDRMIR